MGGRKANDIGTARVCIDVNKGMRKSSSGAFVRAAITLDWIFFVNVLFDNHVALCLRTGLFFFPCQLPSYRLRTIPDKFNVEKSDDQSSAMYY